MKLLCGGLAGTVCWLVAFPLDVVKTQLIVNNQLNGKSVHTAARLMLDQYGPRVFYKGLSPALLRAFPRHAVVLSTFDVISD